MIWANTLSPSFWTRCWLGYERFEKAMLVIFPVCLAKVALIALLGLIPFLTPFLPKVALPLELGLHLFLLICWWRCAQNTRYSWVTVMVRVPVSGLLLLNMIAQTVYATVMHA